MVYMRRQTMSTNTTTDTAAEPFFSFQFYVLMAVIVLRGVVLSLGYIESYVDIPVIATDAPYYMLIELTASIIVIFAFIVFVIALITGRGN